MIELFDRHYYPYEYETEVKLYQIQIRAAIAALIWI